MNIKSFTSQKSAHLDVQLRNLFRNHPNIPFVLATPMQYSVLNGGKYFRALLVYCAGESLGLHESQLDAIAIAVELIHSYSLIHDDLPAMDNAQLRRGKKTCHLVFTEADAILAGDALQMLAIETLANAAFLSDKHRLNVIRELSIAAGAKGMVAGQSLDIKAEGNQTTLEQLQNIHSLKTGALIKASIVMPALISPMAKIKDLSALAGKLGIAYQVQDDILDIEASTETLGKEQGIDAKLEKSTYPNILGLDESKNYLKILHNEIIAILKQNQMEQSKLAALIDLIFKRQH